MKKALSFCGILLALVLLTTSCSKPKQTLHIYNWGDYLADSVIEKFEKEFNCEVKMDIFDSNEAMYAKLKAGAGGYDILVPSSYMAPLMYEQKMIQKLDLSKLPNFTKNFDESYRKLTLDPDFEFCIPYFVSFTGIGYDSEKVKDFEPTWHIFERKDLTQRCSLLDDQRETIGAALCTLGYDVNTTKQEELDKAVELILFWKKNIAKFEVDDAKRALAAGEFLLIQNYSGDMLQVINERPEIKFVIPKEGSTVTFDCLAITADSKNVDLAHAFIDFISRPEIAAENMNEIGYIMPNKAAVELVDESMRNNPVFNIPMADRARCTPLKDLGPDREKYNAAWDRVKAE